ncbi:MAG: MFS transporter [Emticicia sp.]|nr:MFS transporter [Emticicia sp.]
MIFWGQVPTKFRCLNLSGPMTGLLVQPIIGALSDKTWSPRFGRRKPYFLVGALMCSLALLFYPFSSSLWMAASLLWILDVGNNTAMEPYRAFIADKLDASQQPTGFQAQSFFTGLGQTLVNLSIFIFPMIFLGTTGSLPTWVYASFFLGSSLFNWFGLVEYANNGRNSTKRRRISRNESNTDEYSSRHLLIFHKLFEKCQK